MAFRRCTDSVSPFQKGLSVTVSPVRAVKNLCTLPLPRLKLQSRPSIASDKFTTSLLAYQSVLMSPPPSIRPTKLYRLTTKGRTQITEKPQENMRIDNNG